MENVNETDFTLLKVKLNKDGGANVTYQLKTNAGGVPVTNKHSVQSAEFIHSDLRNCFTALRPLMAQVFALPDNLNENVIVNGIAFAGKEENKGCVMVGEYITISGQPSKIASPRIKYLENYYGFELKMQDIANAIQHECFEYLFNGKIAYWKFVFNGKTETR